MASEEVLVVGCGNCTFFDPPLHSLDSHVVFAEGSALMLAPTPQAAGSRQEHYPMISTIEAAAELHLKISHDAPHLGGLFQSITMLRGWATNQEAQSITFNSRLAPGEVSDPVHRRQFMQGFHCVEVNIVARAYSGDREH